MSNQEATGTFAAGAWQTNDVTKIPEYEPLVRQVATMSKYNIRKLYESATDYLRGDADPTGLQPVPDVTLLRPQRLPSHDTTGYPKIHTVAEDMFRMVTNRIGQKILLRYALEAAAPHDKTPIGILRGTLPPAAAIAQYTPGEALSDVMDYVAREQQRVGESYLVGLGFITVSGLAVTVSDPALRKHIGGQLRPMQSGYLDVRTGKRVAYQIPIDRVYAKPTSATPASRMTTIGGAHEDGEGPRIALNAAGEAFL